MTLHLKNQITVPRWLLVILMVIVGIFFISIVLPSQTGAQDAQNLSLAKQVACQNKVKKAECEEAVKACLDQACINRKARPFAAVIAPCRNLNNAQECHTAALTTCKGTSGADRTKCFQESAKATTISFQAEGNKPYTCGSGANAIKTSFNFGCKGVGNPIVDLAFAFIKFLTYGVGLVLIASIIYAGIMYTSSSGNPENTAAAKKRILNAFIGLIFYLLIFAALQYLVPGGLFIT